MMNCECGWEGLTCLGSTAVGTEYKDDLCICILHRHVGNVPKACSSYAGEHILTYVPLRH